MCVERRRLGLMTSFSLLSEYVSSESTKPLDRSGNHAGQTRPSSMWVCGVCGTVRVFDEHNDMCNTSLTHVRHLGSATHLVRYLSLRLFVRDTGQLRSAVLDDPV